jgi:autotransporter family porin
MSSPISKQRNAIRQSIKKLCLSTAIVSAISAPSIAQQVIADGTDETVAPGTVINTGITNGGNGTGLVAKNEGTIRADGPVTITTGGFGAIGVSALNRGEINLTGATINTSGYLAPGISVNGQGARIVTTDTHVSTSGQYSAGVAVLNRGTYIQNGGSITTTGNSASGYQVESGGIAEITDVDVKTSGTGSHGVYVTGNGSSLRMEGGRISTAGAGSHGAFASGAGTLVDLIRTAIVTNGNAAHGLAAQSGGEVNAVDVDVTTHGVGSYGVFAADGGKVSVDGSTISTTGDEAYGAASRGAGSDISIANSTIRTEGYYGATGASDGGHISVRGSRIYTTGSYGHGLEATRNSSAEIENSIIETWGDTAHGLSASAASEIKARNVIITTYRPRAHAVWAGAGGHVVVDSAIINASGYYSSGLFTAGGTIDANNVDVTTSGSEAGGAFAYTGTINLSNSRVTAHTGNGLVAFLSGRVNATNVEIFVDGNRNAGVQASYAGTINLDNVSITGTNGNVGIITSYGGTVIGENVAVNLQSLDDNKAIGLTMHSGNADHLIDLTNSTIKGGGEGAIGLRVAAGGRNTLNLKNTRLEAKDGTAIAVNGSNLDADLDGSSVVGKQLLNVSDYAGTDARAINIRATNGSYLEGDVHVGAGDAQHAAISLDQGSVLKGATDGLHELNVANNSIWQVTGDSNVDTLLNDNGTVAFGPDGAFKTLTVGSLDSRMGAATAPSAARFISFIDRSPGADPEALFARVSTHLMQTTFCRWGLRPPVTC